MNCVKHNYNSSISISFDSMEQFLKECPQHIQSHNLDGYQKLLCSSESDNFYGGPKSVKEVTEKILNNWPEMHTKLLGMWGNQRPELELAISTIQTRRRKRRRGDQGDTLDMHRVWNGELDKAWERPEREVKQITSERHASIFIDVGLLGHVSAKAALWRAAAATLICDLLISAGRAVEIFVGSSAYNCFVANDAPYYCWTSIKVKGYSEPLIPERLSAMCTPGFHRSFGFMLRMCAPYTVRSNKGFSLHKDFPLHLRKRRDAGELVVGIRQCLSRQQAIEQFMKVAAALKKEGVQHEETI